MVGVLEKDRIIRAVWNIERTAIPRLDKGMGLFFSVGLALDKLLNIGMVCVEDDHFRGSAGFPARFDRPRESVKATHERNRAGGRPAALQTFLGRAQHRQVGASAGTPFEQHSLGLGEGQNAIHRVVHRVDETSGNLGPLARYAEVKPNWRVERHVLMQEQVAQLVVERVRVGVGGEVAVLLAPIIDGIGDAGDQLSDGVFALRRADLAPEIFGDNHFGGKLRPRGGNFAVFLLEHDAALPVRDRRRTLVPLGRRVDIRARLGEQTLEADALAREHPRRLRFAAYRLGDAFGQNRRGVGGGRGWRGHHRRGPGRLGGRFGRAHGGNTRAVHLRLRFTSERVGQRLGGCTGGGDGGKRGLRRRRFRRRLGLCAIAVRFAVSIAILGGGGGVIVPKKFCHGYLSFF